MHYRNRFYRKCFQKIISKLVSYIFTGSTAAFQSADWAQSEFSDRHLLFDSCECFPAVVSVCANQQECLHMYRQQLQRIHRDYYLSCRKHWNTGWITFRRAHTVPCKGNLTCVSATFVSTNVSRADWFQAEATQIKKEEWWWYQFTVALPVWVRDVWLFTPFFILCPREGEWERKQFFVDWDVGKKTHLCKFKLFIPSFWNALSKWEKLERSVEA